MAKLATIEGIGPKISEMFAAVGIKTTEALLKRAATPAGRKELVESTKLEMRLVSRFANHADLMRIKGVGGEYSELLEASGVDTVPELAQRNAKNLAAKMAEVNAERKLVRQVPSESQVETWVAEAKELPRVMTY